METLWPMDMCNMKRVASDPCWAFLSFSFSGFHSKSSSELVGGENSTTEV